MPTLETAHHERTRTTEVLDALRAQHRAIDAQLDEMCNLVRGDDRDAMRDTWAKLEDALLAHLNLEEMHLLPDVAHRHPEHVRAVRAEHDKVRATLGEIGLALDLHVARAEQFERLAVDLRAHSAAEETGMYSWAEVELPKTTRELVLRKLRERLATIAGP